MQSIVEPGAKYSLSNTPLSTQKSPLIFALYNNSSCVHNEHWVLFLQFKELLSMAKIIQILKLPNGLMKILVDGMIQGRIKRFTTNANFFEAEIETLLERGYKELTSFGTCNLL